VVNNVTNPMPNHTIMFMGAFTLGFYYG